MKVSISVAQPTPIPVFLTRRFSVAFLSATVGRLDMVWGGAGTCWVHAGMCGPWLGINISSYLPWCECMRPKMCGTPAQAYTLQPESLLVMEAKLSHW